MIRLYLIGITIFLAIFTASGAGFRSMIVEMKDSHGMKVNLSSELGISFANEEIIIAGSDFEIALPLSSIKKWTYSEDSFDSAETIQKDRLTLKNNGDSLLVSGLDGDSLISLYTLSGKELTAERATDTCSIPISGLPGGIYILRVNNQSFKIALNR